MSKKHLILASILCIILFILIRQTSNQTAQSTLDIAPSSTVAIEQTNKQSITESSSNDLQTKAEKSEEKSKHNINEPAPQNGQSTQVTNDIQEVAEQTVVEWQAYR